MIIKPYNINLNDTLIALYYLFWKAQPMHELFMIMVTAWFFGPVQTGQHRHYFKIKKLKQLLTMDGDQIKLGQGAWIGK